MRLGDFSAHVVVEGEELNEYELTVNSSGTQATCWIGSEAGKKFSVIWKRHSPEGPASEARLTVDGIGCVCKALHETSRTGAKNLSKMIRGTKDRDLMFCDLQLSDDEALLGKSVPSHLGEITLRVVRGSISYRRGKAKAPGTALTSHANIYHEKSVKKLTTHCVGFGPERERNCPAWTWRLKKNQDPPLEFFFKYRPIGKRHCTSTSSYHPF
ncbi:hypothetical protein M404DRAFT_991408 [Pisolithus tinctorius Marx 270]|uniref:DUF7918 domain-containing protein n=1 Tax=Pisolithus tinctorius Marx 270 TaxID=870435 RepID=A0A0C3KYP2_PISTI|nr:hypothetical protein M404DRAFT_991408 [Pisolithus tinctorius Marx 270]